MSGDWLCLSPLGAPAQGTGPFPHTWCTGSVCAEVRSQGASHPTSPQSPSPAGNSAQGGQPPQGRLLASGVGSKVGGTSPVLSREQGTAVGTCVGSMFFDASVMIFKQ